MAAIIDKTDKELSDELQSAVTLCNSLMRQLTTRQCEVTYTVMEHGNASGGVSPVLHVKVKKEV